MSIPDEAFAIGVLTSLVQKLGIVKVRALLERVAEKNTGAPTEPPK